MDGKQEGGAGAAGAGVGRWLCAVLGDPAGVATQT